MSNKFLNVKFGADTKDFKRGTNEVRSELTELNSAMRKNKREQKDLNDEIKKLEKEQKNLKTVMSQVKKPTKEMTEEADRLQRALDEAALKSAKLKTEEQELKGKISATTKELNEQNASADKNAMSMEKIGGAIKKAAALTATGMAALFTYTSKMAASADEINTIAKQTGLATDEIQKFMYASELVDVSLDTLTGSMSRLIRNMNTAATTGSGTAYDAFVALNVAVTDTSGTLRNNKDVFYEIIDKLGKIEDETQRDAYAMSLFGKSAQELNPLILGGTEQLKAFGDELEREGLILDQMQLDKLNEFNDKIDTFKAKFQAKMMSSSTDWVDAFDELLDKSDEIVDLVATLITGFAKVTGFIVEHKDAVLALVIAYGSFKTVMNVKNLAKEVIATVKSLSKATDGATKSQTSLNSAIKAAPYLLLATLAASLIKSYTSASRAAKEVREEHSATLNQLKSDYETALKSNDKEIEQITEKGERYEELRLKLKRTADEERELYNIASELEGKYSNEIKLIDAKTGAYIALGDQLDTIKEKMINTAKVQAITDALAEAYAYDLELDQLAQEAGNDTMSAAEKADKHSITLGNTQVHYGAFSNNAYRKEFAEASEIWEAIRKNGEWIVTLEEELSKYNGTMYDSTIFSDNLGDANVNLATSLISLKESYSLLSSAEKELETSHELSVETLNSLTTKYPSLKGVVNDYISGIASGEDVINRLGLAYENDVKNHENALVGKLNTDADYYSKLQQMNGSIINTLANQYGIDLSNYQNYSEAKLAIQKAFLSASAKNWASYYDAESNTYKITDKDLMQLKKELRASGMSESEVKKEVEKYKNDYWDTRNAVNAWNKLAYKIDDNIYDFAKDYINNTLSGTSSGSGSGSGSGSNSSSSSTKKEVSVYEQARASYSKLINDRIAEIKELTNAETAGCDERIAAINAEIDARKKLSETDDLQKRIDFVKGQLKYSLLDDFERQELEKELSALEKEKEDRLWEEGKKAEIAAIEEEKAAIEKNSNEQITDLQNRQNYANTIFSDLQNGYKSSTTIANDNSKTANITIVEKALTEGQVTQIVKDALGIEEVF